MAVVKHRPSLLFAHGWGFDSSLWDGIRDLLPEFDAVCIERGYLGAIASRPPVPAGTVLVGHSAGLVDLLINPPPGCTTLIAINGFTRLGTAPDWPAGTPIRLLERMLTRLGDDPDGTLEVFRQRCGHAGPAVPVTSEAALRSGLLALRDDDARTTPHRPVLALAGVADPIVSPALTRASFPGSVIAWQADGGHLLPLTHPVWCAGHLRQVITV